MERVPFFCLLLSMTALSSQAVAAPGDITGSLNYCGYNVPITVYLDKHSFVAQSSDGDFTLHGVPAGTYDLVAKFPAHSYYPAFDYTQSVTLNTALLDLGTVQASEPTFGCPVDSDGDGIFDQNDPCPFNPDPNCFVPQTITDVIVVNGTEWAQADLFKDLSWDDIEAVCPAGVCTDGALLNGYIMTGWRWASAVEVNALFNYYAGATLVGPGPDYHFEKDAAWATAMFDDGWREIYSSTQPYPAVNLRGWLSDAPNSFNYVLTATWRDSSSGNTDVIDTRSINFKGQPTNTLGAFFYKP